MSEARQVVVITGASSGIGRATALEFAERGAALVLAARRGLLVDEVAAECRRAGARGAIGVATDVTDVQAVMALAAAALGQFGGIDVWVNNAGVSLFARFEEAPLPDYRRVVETNLFGYVHSARAVMPHFRERRRGVLINVGSILGTAAAPYQSAYVASQHAVRGLSESLRQELELEGLDRIFVCSVTPGTVDTPFFQHAANYTGRTLQAMPPVYPASKVARAIVNLARHPQREVHVGGAARAINWQQTKAPATTERMMADLVERTHFDATRSAPATSGNLYGPVSTEAEGVSGGWMRRGRFATGLLAAVPVALWLVKRARRGGSKVGRVG